VARRWWENSWTWPAKKKGKKRDCYFRMP